MPRFSNAELTRLTMPVLLVFGEQDAMLNAKDAARRARKRLPNAETVLLPGAGHMLIDQRERALQFYSDEALLERMVYANQAVDGAKPARTGRYPGAGKRRA